MSNPYPPNPYGSSGYDPYQQPQTNYPQQQGGYTQQGDYSQPPGGYSQPSYNQPPPAYAPPGYAQPVLVAQAQTNSKAIVALILGIISWVGASILTGIPAIIVGHMSLREINSSGGTQEGRPLAIIGLVLGYLSVAGVVFLCFFLIFVLGIFGAAATTTP